MQFSQTSSPYDGILQNCESLSNLGNTGITGNTILLGKFTGWVNDAYGKIARAVLTVDKQWRWDDSNWGSNSNQSKPVATATLETGVRDYVLPRATNSSDRSSLWKVYKVRIKDTNGEWYDLVPLGTDESESADEGRPTKYRLLNGTIRLSDIPATGYVTLTAGIQVWFQREFSRFTTSMTDTYPQIMSDFHYLFPLWASATFLKPTDRNLANTYLADFAQGIEDLKKAYAQRNDDPNTIKRMTPKVSDTR
jgi:hypothetical protein